MYSPTQFTARSPLPEMPLLPITSPATVEACRGLEVTDRDIFICSYPKSGTTWTQNLVCRLLAAYSEQDLAEDWHLSHSAPFYEVDQYWEEDGSRKPAQTPLISSKTGNNAQEYRVFNTHLRPHQLPPQAKCIYVMRDPLDVLASFYYHLIHMAQDDGGYEGTAAEFCKDFVEGTILYGKWQDHMEAFLSTNVSQPRLSLHYDEMKEDLTREATKVASFLGVPDELLSTVVHKALPHCTFSSMRDERWRYSPKSVDWKVDPATGKPYGDFIRSGRIGDGETFWETYATSGLQEQWQKDRTVAKQRWSQAGVSSTIIGRYLSNC